jgi:hypothetical protein
MRLATQATRMAVRRRVAARGLLFLYARRDNETAGTDMLQAFAALYLYRR